MGVSAIEWTQETWNPVSGCTRVSAGCDHCYAVGMTHRAAAMGQEKKYGGLTVLNPKGDRHFNGKVRCHPEAVEIPLRRRKPKIWFVNSMSDLFHKDVPFDFIDKVFATIALAPHHTFQILTKRPERMAEYLSEERESWIAQAAEARNWAPGVDWDASDCHLDEWPLPNVWLGTSVEDQDAADERIPHLLRCPAAVRFLSCEPLLGPLNLNPWLMLHSDCCNSPIINKGWCVTCDRTCRQRPRPGWVIAGGESGVGARPCNVEWIRGIVQQCKAAGVPVFVKQLGADPTDTADGGYDEDGNEFSSAPHDVGLKLKSRKGSEPAEWPADLRVREMPQLSTARKPSSAQHLHGRAEGGQPVDNRGGAQ
jgi:protein gp37